MVRLSLETPVARAALCRSAASLLAIVPLVTVPLVTRADGGEFAKQGFADRDFALGSKGVSSYESMKLGTALKDLDDAVNGLRIEEAAADFKHQQHPGLHVPKPEVDELGEANGSAGGRVEPEDAAVPREEGLNEHEVGPDQLDVPRRHPVRGLQHHEAEVLAGGGGADGGKVLER